MYGSNCDMPCPVNCKVNACHIQNGNCFECDPGWQGTYCDKGTCRLYFYSAILKKDKYIKKTHTVASLKFAGANFRGLSIYYRSLGT